MCVCVCVLVPRGAQSSWLRVRCGAVCFGLGCNRAPPLLAGLRCGVCVYVCAPRLYPAIPGWGVRCGRVCLAPVPAVPRHSWLGCWGACAFVRVPRLHPAIPGGPVCVYVGLAFVRSPVFLASWLVCWGACPLLRAASVSRHLPGGPPVAWGCAGVAVGGVWPLPSPLGFFFNFLFRGGCPGVSRPGLLVLVAGCPGLWSRGLRPPFPSRLGYAFVYFLSFFRVRPSVVSVCVFGMSLLPVGRCSRSGVAGFGWVFLWCLLRGSRLWCRLAGAFGHLLRCGWAVLWSSALFVPPPPFFSGGAVCLFLSRPSLGIRCCQAGRCWCLCFARPCPPVGYVHAWLGGPSCRVRFWLCRPGGCARRLREALG